MTDDLEIQKLKDTIAELVSRGADYLRKIEELEQQVAYFKAQCAGVRDECD